MGESWQIFREFKGSRNYIVSSRPELHGERRKNKEERRRKRKNRELENLGPKFSLALSLLLMQSWKVA